MFITPQKRKTILFFVFFIASYGILSLFTKAWSAVDFLHSVQPVKHLTKNYLFVPNNVVVPEPNSLALFGSGILTMILAFVRRTYALTKRAIDIVGSLIAMVLAFPLFVLTALFIKLTSPGPVFYTQTRVGKDGENFEIFKFRTMRVDAEKTTGPVWASKNDNRLIPGGKFIRKARLDELPQFLNVLRGEMSIIGPRPERPVFVEQFKQTVTDYAKRLDVKPGITGLAQVHHHYDETIADVRKKIRYDILYIKNMCFWTDVRILARTVRVVLTGAGAK